MKWERPDRKKSTCIKWERPHRKKSPCMTWETWERGRHERAGKESAAVHGDVGHGISRLDIRSGNGHLVGRVRLFPATAVRAGGDRHARPDLLGSLHLELRVF